MFTEVEDEAPVELRTRSTLRQHLPIFAVVFCVALLSASVLAVRMATPDAVDGQAGSPAAQPETADDRALDPSVLTVLSSVLKEGIPAAGDAGIRTVALDPNWQPLASDTREPFKFAYALAGSSDSREWKLYVAAPGADQTGSGGCPKEVTFVQSCSERQTADGNEITSTYVSVADKEVGHGLYTAIEPNRITPDMWPDLRVERIVRLQLPNGGVVSAQEAVYGVHGADLEGEFVAAEALSGLVHGEELLRTFGG